ncbi:CDP-alcohol phosphatidyltransferase family protein [Corynebacterium poyangense]|uniref:Phosphatidylinositol phosphate synthase n=1 Tax=Corynebacterium poyangense TaxID=2684405 RepID=A0A7H0SP63_9CORY|nr:CDP-alcohol phosphatidyltransferase family protein [Corynebacterium poyangense]MBZ8177907.1 CDP-alcohol phosphatidyltransferase family protein [Corynebacterium poyangense]QNQ90338.1 CDP-alcohol phosphatidyltransferase family protein [Corynebacterium poyangense]
MLSVHGRRPMAVILEPIARFLLKFGISPNAVTVVGAAITAVIAVTLIPSDHLVLAAILSGIFAAFDMVDGTMARKRGGGTSFGATLDATCDRITDGVLFGAITWWLIYHDHASRFIVIAAFTVLITSQVISYVKARAEAGGLHLIGGLVERPERLILGLVGIGLEGLGVPWAIETALILLAIGSIVTVIQRLVMASRDPHAEDATAPPAGASEAN